VITTVRHRRQHRQRGIGARLRPILDHGGPGRSEDERREAITAAEVDRPCRPTCDGVVGGDDEQAHRAADAGAESSDIDRTSETLAGPAPKLLAPSTAE